MILCYDPTKTFFARMKRDTEAMLFKRWRPWLWGLLAAVLGAELWFGYRFGRRELHDANAWFNAAPGLFEEAFVLGLLAGPIALPVAWTLSRHYPRTPE